MYMKHNGLFFFILLIAILSAIPQLIWSQESSQLLYEVNDSTTFEELDSQIRKMGFEKVDVGSLVNNDTTSLYDYLLSRIVLDYTPKTNIISSFTYRCRRDFDSLFESLKERYGNPSSVIIYERHNDEYEDIIDDKDIIDTLNMLSLYNNPNKAHHFVIKWDNSERLISLSCENGYSYDNVEIEYKYTNKNNQIIRQKEIVSKIRSEGFMVFLKRALIAAAILIAFIFFYKRFQKHADEERIEAERRRQQRHEEIMQKQKEEEETKQRKIQEYEDNYGSCTKVIPNPKDNTCDYVRVYDKASVIILNDTVYDFAEIIGYSLTDNSTVIKGDLSSTTSTSNASAIGRAVVGVAIGGVAGAVIGGATAKQKTEYKQGKDKTIHDYTVNININSLSEPLVKLHIGKYEDTANEIAELINAIVVRNRR